MPATTPSPLVLENEHVRLEPLTLEHAASLLTHASPETFRHFVTLQPRSMSEADFTEFVRSLIALPQTLPFAVVPAQQSEAVGITCYMDIRAAHLGLEIGLTWYGAQFRGTAINPASKRLLLAHAFDELGYERVQLKTDARNEHSQAAIRKLGATCEGTLRRHMRMPDGFMRDTVMFSILRSEWPQVRAQLDARLAVFAAAPSR